MADSASSIAAPKTCSIDRYGKVTTFSGEALDVEAPCKYKLAQFTCGAFKVFVTAGSALDGDSNNRFSPDTAWIKVQRELGGQTVEWIGRTSAGLIKKVSVGAYDDIDEIISLTTTVMTTTKVMTTTTTTKATVKVMTTGDDVCDDDDGDGVCDEEEEEDDDDDDDGDDDAAAAADDGGGGGGGDDDDDDDAFFIFKSKKAADPTGSLEVWTVKEDSLTVNNGFVGGSTPAAKLAKTVDGTTFFEIFIREPDTSGDDAGITVSCLNEDDFSDSKAYPKSICGDGAATNTVNQRKLVLFPGGGGDRSKTVLFDILNDVTITQSKTCSLIAFLFQNDCGGDAEKAAAIDTCGNIFGKRPLAKCLVNDGAIDDDFRKCLINKCYDAACNQLKTTVNDAANACPGDALTSDGYLRQLTCAQ
nr:hypothetical protein BaRGS_020813 [Batillaria attramentaria]